jgi:hypothetical protein
MGNQLILVVQIQHPERFPLKAAICSRSHSRTAWVEVKATPGSCRCRSSALSARLTVRCGSSRRVKRKAVSFVVPPVSR